MDGAASATPAAGTLRAVYHYRVTVSGPAPAVDAITAELACVGAKSVEIADPPFLVIASADPIETWEATTRRHPTAVLGIEWFEALDDEFVQLLVENGHTTEMSHLPILPDGWGGWHDEDGEPLDEGLLRRAARSVEAQRLRRDPGTLTGGLDTGATMGRALGRLCCRVEPTMFGEPSRDALDAIIEVAVFALWISASAQPSGQAECEFEHALWLTRAVLHAGRDELWDQPGNASWSEWLQLLIGAGSGVIDAACHCWYEAETEAHAVAAEHGGAPPDQLTLEARSLLTTCLQALALFDPTLGHTPSEV